MFDGKRAVVKVIYWISPAPTGRPPRRKNTGKGFADAVPFNLRLLVCPAPVRPRLIFISSISQIAARINFYRRLVWRRRFQRRKRSKKSSQPGTTKSKCVLQSKHLRRPSPPVPPPPPTPTAVGNSSYCCSLYCVSAPVKCLLIGCSGLGRLCCCRVQERSV